MPRQARAMRFAAPGRPEVLKPEMVDVPYPGHGEVMVTHAVIGVNYQDTYHRSGFYPLPLPSGIGTEAAGSVASVGPHVDFRIGDRVVYCGGAPGAYAEARTLSAERLVKIPDGITDEQAAAVLLKGMTAEYLLHRCYAVQPGQFVLFYAAAGGVGLLAGQWGKHLGARMIGVAGGAEKCRLAAANGYEFVIDRAREDIVERVKEIAGGGVPVVYDSVGKASFDTSIKCLAPRGVFVSFGSTTGPVPPVEAGLLQKAGSLYFTRPTLVTYTAKREELDASAKAVFDLIAKGVLKVHVNQRYKFDDAVRVHQDLEAGRTTGSSVIVL